MSHYYTLMILLKILPTLAPHTSLSGADNPNEGLHKNID